MIRFILLLLSIPLIVVIATFSYRNAQSVQIDVFINTYHLPLSAVLLVVLLAGGILGYAINFFVVLKLKNKIRQITKQRQEMLGLADVLKINSK